MSAGARRKAALRAVETAAFRAGLAAFSALPLDAASGVAGSLARGIGVHTPLERRAARNLAFALPELDPQARRAALRGMFDNLARTAVEYLHLSRLAQEEDRIAVEGLEHLEAARRAGRGAVILTGHFGAWEPIRIAAGRIGWTPAIIYRAFNNATVDAEGARLMAALGAPVLHKGRKGSLAMLRHVRAGGAALILFDQRVSNAPELPFFGHPAPTVPAAAEIAGRYGAALIPARGVRLGRASRFQVTFEPPIPVPDEAGAEAAMTEANARLEAWIRAHPDQYFWLHHRWGRGRVKRALAARGAQAASRSV